MKTIFILAACIFGLQAYAQSDLSTPSVTQASAPAKLSPEELQWVMRQNKLTQLKGLGLKTKLSSLDIEDQDDTTGNIIFLDTEAQVSEVPPSTSGSYFLPYAEYNKQGYLIFNDGLNFNSMEAKRGFLRNLPDHMIAVIYTWNRSPEYVQNLRETHSIHLKNPEWLAILPIPVGGDGFWARDTIPVPGFFHSNKGTEFGVVDAKYYHRHEPDKIIAENFDARLISHDYYYEGGNFIPNAKGHCLIVDGGTGKNLPNSILHEKYGCVKVVRLPYLRGIGHADESVKFISDNEVITDLKEYVPILEKEGYVVHLMPRAKLPYETYINSVMLGKKVVIPAYGRAQDQDAANAYRALGFTPVLLDSNALSNQGKGSLHCISMVYPFEANLIGDVFGQR